MKKLVNRKRKIEIQCNLLMVTRRSVVKVNILDSCEMCYFCKKKGKKSYCSCWGNLREIKYPKGRIIEANCCLFSYESFRDYDSRTKTNVCGLVLSGIDKAK